MTIIDKIKDLLRMLAENIHKRRRVVLALSCVVVFVTTYMLILPAFTLEKTKAAEQGGIDVPGVTTTAEDVSEEDADANDGQADAQDVQTESGKTEDGKVEDSGSKESKDSGDTNADVSGQTADPLTFEDEHYTIAVDDKNSVLPENTEIKVEEIDKNEDAKKYQKHFDDALAAIQEEKDGENVSDLEFARFYDISLVSDGKEVTLGSGDKVSVNIEYDKELRKALGVENKDNIRIIHFAENKDTGKVEAEVLDNQEAKVEVNTDSKDQLKETSFEAESFSVYAVVYTVDFEYEDEATHEVYKYSIEGGSSITLKKLAVILGITAKDKADEFIANVEDVKFSDKSLVKVEKTDNGWTLKSLKAFDTTETLTITMKDGSVYEVKVTDANEADLYDSVSTDADGNKIISVSSESDATYDATESAYSCKFKVNFTIPTETIKSQKSFALELGPDIKIPDAYLGATYTGYDRAKNMASFDYHFEKRGDRYYMVVDYRQDYLDKTNYIGSNFVTLNALIKDTVEKDEENLHVKFTDEMNIDVPATNITYPDNDNGKNNIAVDKDYVRFVEPQDGMPYAEYHVVISSSKGTDENITLSDKLSNFYANGMEGLDIQSVEITEITKKSSNGASSSVSVGTQPTLSEKAFSYDLEKLNAGESYEITYRYYYNHKLPSEGSFNVSTGANNSATVTSGDIKDKDGDSFNVQKDNSNISISKGGKFNGTDEIEWTITVTYKGSPGVNVNGTNYFSLTDEAFAGLSASDITCDGNFVKFSNNDNKIYFTQAGTYVIKYKTKVDPQLYNDAKVTNNATAENGTPADKRDIGPVDVVVPHTGSIDKELANSSQIATDGNKKTYELTWSVTIPVPDGGFPAGTVITDKMGLYTYGWEYNAKEKAQYFTNEQKTAFDAALAEYFGDGNFDSSFTEDTANNGGYIYTFTSKNDWDGTVNGEKVNQIVLEYKTTAVVNTDTIHTASASGEQSDLFKNNFSVGNVSSEASWEYHENVKKMDGDQKRGTTTKTLTKEKNELTWIVVVDCDDNYYDMSITDTLPAGTTLTSIQFGDQNNLMDMSSSDGGITYTPAQPWYSGQAARLGDMTASAAVNGSNVTLDLHLSRSEGKMRPDWFVKNGKVWVKIKASVNEDQFDNLVNNVIDYTNNVSVTADGEPKGSDSQTQTTTLDSETLKKGSSTERMKNYHEVEYSVDINKDGHHIMVADDGTVIENETFTFDDTLDFVKTASNGGEVTVMLVPGSVELLTSSDGNTWNNYSGDWAYQYVETKDGDIRYKTISLSNLPDDTRLRLKYKYRVEVQGTTEPVDIPMHNKATLHGVHDFSIDNHTNTHWEEFDTSGGTESLNSLTIGKVDVQNYNVTLPNTLFILEKWNGSSWEYVPAIADDPTSMTTYSGTQAQYQGKSVYKTDDNGNLQIMQSIIPGATRFEEDVVYRLREFEPTTVASGEEPYIISDDPDKQPAAYFYFGGDNKDNINWPNNERIRSLADDLNVETDTFYMTNTKHAYLKVTKIFLGDMQGQVDKSQIKFTVKDKETGTKVAELTYDDIQHNNNTITQGIENGKTYIVEESIVDVDGAVRTSYYSVNGTDDVVADSDIAAEVQIENNVGTVDFTNKYESEKTSIKVTKEWFDYLGNVQNNPSATTIKFQVYQLANGSTEGVPYIPSGSEEAPVYEINYANGQWDVVTVDNLRKYDNDGNEYRYYVVETEPNTGVSIKYSLGNSAPSASAQDAATSNDNKTVTITNTDCPPPGSLVVKKKWDNVSEKLQIPVGIELWAKAQGEGEASKTDVYIYTGYYAPNYKTDPNIIKLDVDVNGSVKVTNTLQWEYEYKVYKLDGTTELKSGKIQAGNSETISISEPCVISIPGRNTSEYSYEIISAETIDTTKPYRTEVLNSNNSWTAEFDNLPAGYTYYVKENVTGFDVSYEYTDSEGNITSGTTADGSELFVESGSVTITNARHEEEKGSVKVTKSFSGINKLPDGFKITASWTDGLISKSVDLDLQTDGVIGTGTATDPYTWTIEDLPLDTVVTFEESGYDAEGYVTTITKTGIAVEGDNKTAAMAAATPGAAGFVNSYTEENTDFEFTKEWHNDAGGVEQTWKNGLAINVNVQRKIGQNGSPENVGSYVIRETTDGFQITKSNNAPTLVNVDGTFTFKLTDLPKSGKIGDVSGEYIYFATETEAVDGYKDPEYSNPSATNSGQWTSSPEGAMNGGKIINKPVESYELPHTGGIGTTIFYILGSILVIGGGIYFISRRRAMK